MEFVSKMWGRATVSKRMSMYFAKSSMKGVANVLFGCSVEMGALLGCSGRDVGSVAASVAVGGSPAAATA